MGLRKNEDLKTWLLLLKNHTRSAPQIEAR
jgi:hypothetical protein